MKTIRTGYKGNEVRLMCENLNRNGLHAATGETFTEEMKGAVVAFQRNNGLDADGIVGYRTWEALLFNGRAHEKKLSEADFELLAMLLDCEAAALKAVQKVETGGRGGFFAEGKPAILFEGHIFWNRLRKRGINPEDHVSGNENILYPKWTNRYYAGGLKEYDRLLKARVIDREAADASASWGMFQIMGFNYAACDEESVGSFVAAMCESELRQLILSGRFIRKAGMLPALQNRNWAEFARRYNGPAYAQNRYDEKLAAAYNQFKA